MNVVIVGAGTFGASLAWLLARAGERVTLVDQFEPGDRRATSGGETRLIRCSHGADAEYTAMARRSRTLWRELEADCGDELMVECGVSWFAHSEQGWEAASERAMREQGIPCERLDVAEGPAASRASAGTTSRSSCTSRRRACCAPSARCRRSPRRPPRTARRSSAAEP